MMRNREYDGDYEEEAISRRRKQPKKNTILPSRMIWTKDNELAILKGIVDYLSEKGFSYEYDWDLCYSYIKGLLDLDFSKIQLQTKVRKLKMRFSDISRSKDWEGVTFTSTDDEQVFNLSTIIWGKNETDEDMQEKDQQPKEVNVSVEDVPCPDHEPTRVEKEQEEDGSYEFCVLQEVLEAASVFPTFGKNQQKMLLRNLKNLPVLRKKELTHEWRALLDEEMKLNIKKLTFEAKLANPNV